MKKNHFPVGKLPPDHLEKLIGSVYKDDAAVVLGPGTGLDCAVLDLGSTYLAVKSDPITFTEKDIAWYLVHVNANDIATTGAIPRWLMVTILLPEKLTTISLVEDITKQLAAVCDEIGVVIIGGHTEITVGLDRPLLVGTMLGTVQKERLISPTGIGPGDQLLLTKSVPIEATAILAREFATELNKVLDPGEMAVAGSFLKQPGISVLHDAQIAIKAGRVTGMHDPTEGGLSMALWEMAAASSCSLLFEPQMVPVATVSQKICNALHIDPFQAISSGALLIAVSAADTDAVVCALDDGGVGAVRIGEVESRSPGVWIMDDDERRLLPRPSRDDVAKLLDGRKRQPQAGASHS